MAHQYYVIPAIAGLTTSPARFENFRPVARFSRHPPLGRKLTRERAPRYRGAGDSRSWAARGGGLVGGLVGAGIPEIEAKRYAGRIREGGYLISVHGDDGEWANRAKEILQATHDHDVVSTAEAAPDYRP